ncbi:S49 family peptidase [Ruegeria litorea]|uniref:S49 family peptidase n=1 Tax=Falsiruegeria litorea TaxID=1280831 RepID=A0ABS5WUU3_9RHOB|nr:S49 family peptidase [Falsiruegeria litorea]MBT3142908.1 S49 family peptidase [Falsiruegeria litorea]
MTQMVSALIGTSHLALSAEHGLPMLQMELPETEASLSVQAIQIERGQRFVVQRGVAFVPVRGVLTPNSALLEKYLGWATYHGLAETMAMVTASDEVRAAVLVFDTPGGAVMGVQAGVEAIRAAAAVKPIHGIIHPLAASAGYWLASQCTDLALTPGSWVGSVGTMSTSYSAMQPGGSGEQLFIQTSAHAGAKRPDASTEEGAKLIQNRIDAMEAEFLTDVSKGRNIEQGEISGRMSRTDSDQDGGDVFWGVMAQVRGLVDSQETLADFLSRIAGQYAPKPRTQSKAYLAQAQAALDQSEL